MGVDERLREVRAFGDGVGEKLPHIDVVGGVVGSFSL